MLPLEFLEHYKKDLARNGFDADEAQRRAARAFDELSRSLLRNARGGWLVRIARRSSWPSPRGLYLWGGVGRGKTYLMDLFFAQVPIERKFRVHFHRFMRLVHDELRELKAARDPLDRIASQLANRYLLICLDEFFVSDIADAMILGRLLRGLFERKVTLVTTSNVPPGELYRDGLQRQQFLPAIDLLQGHCSVLHLEGGTDYRLRQLESAAIYLTPIDANTEAELRSHFEHLAPGEAVDSQVLGIESRPIESVRCAEGVAWFSFDALCDGPRSQNDYIELARLFHTVILEGIPVFTPASENQARRFIALVDEFYDRRVKLIASAQAEIALLYQGKRLGFEFERTRSRLIEMQSHDYLAQAHIA